MKGALKQLEAQRIAKATARERVTISPTKPLTRRETPNARICACGAALKKPPRGPWPKHCSPACMQKAYRQRKAGE